MKKNKKMLIFIYILILVALIAIIFLTKTVLELPKPKQTQSERSVEKIDINQYPNVNNECTFNVSLSEYQALKMAGCTGGYTRYDIQLEEMPLKITIIYSDKEKVKTGLFVNDKKITSAVDDITNIKFGVFDEKLFILDTNNNKTNVYSVNKKGKLIYNLEEELKENKIKEFATGDEIINAKNIDPISFNFYEGGFEFNSSLSTCQSNAKGSHYKVTYNKEKFEKPEFMNLIQC